MGKFFGNLTLEKQSITSCHLNEKIDGIRLWSQVSPLILVVGDAFIFVWFHVYTRSILQFTFLCSLENKELFSGYENHHSPRTFRIFFLFCSGGRFLPNGSGGKYLCSGCIASLSVGSSSPG